MQLKLLFTLAVLVFVTSLQGQERNWTDDTGKFNIEAELISVENNTVVLRKADGKEMKVPLNRLSSDDRKFIRKWQADQKKNSDSESSTDTAKKMDLEKSGDNKGKSENEKSEKTDWLAGVKAKATAKREAGFDYDFNSKDPKPEIVTTIEISGKAAAKAISYGKLTIESFKDGKGNDLELAEEKFGPDISKEMEKIAKRGDDFFAAHPKDGIRVKVKSIDKSGRINKISAIKGTIDVLTGGTAKSVVLKDVSKHKTGNVESPVLTELDIKCEFERTEKQVTLKFKGDVSNMASLTFLDKKNKEVEPDGWSAGGGGNLWQNSYDFEKIPVADLVIEFRIGPETVTLPFEAKNIKIKKN